MEALITFITAILKWVLDLLLWVPRKVFELFTDALGAIAATLISPVSADQFLQNIQALAPGTLWFLEMTNAPFGLGIVLSAVAARFVLKLIPTLGF